MGSSPSRSLKIIAGFLIICFGLNYSVFPSSQFIPAVQNIPSSFETLQIPPALGFINKKHFPQRLSSDGVYLQKPLIFHIQDPHTSIEGQMHIASIIEYLHHNYGANLLFVEGATHRLNPSLYKLFDQKDISEKFYEGLLKEGELTGAEQFLLNQESNRKNITVEGIESEDLYIQNIEEFKKVKSSAKATQQALMILENAFDRNAAKTLNKDLMALLKSQESYKRGKQTLVGYLDFIGRFSKDWLSLDLGNPKNQIYYPMLVRYFNLKSLEAALDEQKVDADKKKLIQFLREKKVKKELIKKIDSLSPETPSIRDSLEKVIEDASLKEFSFEDYPQWSRWAGLMGLQQEIDSESFFKEVETLTNLLFDSLAKTESEKRLVKFYQQLTSLEKLSNLELTRKEWEQINQEPDALSPILLAKNFGLDAKKFWELQNTFSNALSFYEIAENRDRYFWEKIQNILRTRTDRVAVLITGGFHADGISELLESNGISYIQILPRISDFDKKADAIYQNALTEHSSLQRFLRLQPLSQMSNKELSLVDPDYRLDMINRALRGLPPPIHKKGTILDELAQLKKTKRSEMRVSNLFPVPDAEATLTKYYSLKRDLIAALDLDQEEHFRDIYAGMEALLPSISQIMNQISDDQLLTLHKKISSSANTPAHLTMILLEDSEAKKVLWNELTGISRQQLDPDTKRKLDVIVEEVAAELYQGTKQQEIKQRIIESIYPFYFREFLPLRNRGQDFPTWKASTQSKLLKLWQEVGGTWGSYDPYLKRIFVHSNLSDLVLRSTIKHELVHYLAAIGEIKIPVQWETLTYAVDVIERVKHARPTIEGGEKALSEYSEEFGEPALAALYERGKELAKSGQIGFFIRPGVSDLHASYFSIDTLVAQARQVYTELNLPTARLLDSYNAQRAAAILIGGILMQMEGLQSQKPLALLRDFFQTLYERFAPPDQEEVQRIMSKGGLLSELQSYAASLAGMRIEMVPAESGLWLFEPINEWNAKLHYVISDLYPRFYDGNKPSDKMGQRKAAYERGLGQVLFAVSKKIYGKQSLSSKIDSQISGNPAFPIFWESMLTPQIISQAFSRNRQKIHNLTVAKKFEGAPQWLAKVFEDRYNIGNPLVAQSLLASLPLHLQYLDSLIYRWVHYDPKQHPELDDPRLKNPIVEEAIRETFGDSKEKTGWGKILLQSHSLSDEELLHALTETVWPVYHSLYEKAVEEEKLRLTSEQIKQKDIQKSVEDFWNNLPQELQDAIEQAAVEAVGQMMSQYNQGAGQKTGGTPSSKSPTEAAGQMGSFDTAGLETAVQQLGKLMQSMDQSLSDLATQLSETKSGVHQVSNSAAGIGEEKERRQNAAKVQSQSKEVQGQAHELLEKVRDVQQMASLASKNAHQIPPTDQLNQLKQDATQGAEASDELLSHLEAVQKMANALKDKAERLLSELQTSSPDESHISAQANSIRDAASAIENQLQGAQGEARNLTRLVHQIQAALSKAKQKIEHAQEARPEPQLQTKTTSHPPAGMEGVERGHAKEAQILTAPENSHGLNSLTNQFVAGTHMTKEPPRKALFDEQWVQALHLEEELNLKKKTGLNAQEYAEYQQWLNYSIFDEQGRPITVRELINNGTAAIRFLTLPLVGLEIHSHLDRGTMLKYVVEAGIGGKGFAVRQTNEALPVKLSFLLDRSGSMAGDSILYAKLTALVFLEILFNHNEERNAKGFDPIEFEVGLFTFDDSLQLSHDTSTQLSHYQKERLIYDLLKRIEAGGGTNYAESMGRFLLRLQESPDRRTEKSRRIFISISDEDVGQSQKDAIAGLILNAEENGTLVLPINVAGTDPLKAIPVPIHDTRTLPSLPALSLLAFVNHLAPPGMKLERLDARSEVRNSNEEPLAPIEGYRHFFLQEIDGRSFLVFKKGNLELKWERGLGGADVPQVKVPDIDYNEEKILQILQKMYRQGVTYTSYSADGKYFIRLNHNNFIEVFERNREGVWQSLREVNPLEIPLVSHKPDYFENREGLRWDFNGANGRMRISQQNGNYVEVEYEGKLNQQSILFEQGQDRVLVYSLSEQAILVLKKEGDRWIATSKMAIEKETVQNTQEGRMVELTGETGLGKGELIRAAAFLMNEPVYFMAGNEDMEVEDLFEYRTLGVEQAGVSGYLPTVLTRVRHEGGWIVLDEGHKLKDKVFNELKSSVASKSHKWRISGEGGVKKLVTVKDHPRTRILVTSNLERKGIVTIRRGNDQAMQRRKRIIPFHWMKPDEEVEMHLSYAKQEAQQSGLYKDWDVMRVNQFEEQLRNTVENLMKAATKERLVFAGYNANQIAQTLQNWKLLEDPFFKPANPVGAMLKRPPSPRVIKQIVRHFLYFPKDLEFRPWSIIHRYYNFYAEKDTKKTYSSVPSHYAAEGFSDSGNHQDLLLNENSFRVEGDYLIVTPVSKSGALSDWDPVQLTIHPSASIRHGVLPESVKAWITNPENSKLFYQILQTFALNRDVILVGEQETGKSTIARAIQELLSGPDLIEKSLSFQTAKEELTYTPHMGEEGQAFQSGFLKAPIPQAMNDQGYGKILALEESNQARPGVQALLNEVSERRYLLNPAGKQEAVGPVFRIIHLINPPEEGFDVMEYSDEFIERHAVFFVRPLEPKNASLQISEAGSYEGLQINPRLIGEPLFDTHSKPVLVNEVGEPVSQDGIQRWTGFMGIEQSIRFLRKKDPRALPRAPGVGTWKDLVRELRDYFEFRRQYEEKRGQDVLLEIFLETFTLQGSSDRVAVWRDALRNVFKENGLWSDDLQKDALAEFLNGEDVIVQSLNIIKEPTTGNFEIDRCLRYLQTNTTGNGVDQTLQDLMRLAKDLYSDTEWSGLKFAQKLQRVFILKEMYQILGIILAERKDPGKGPAHRPENLRAIEILRNDIQTSLIIQKDWPESILNSSDAAQIWIGRYGDEIDAGDPVATDLLEKMKVFGDDLDYLTRQSEKLAEHMSRSEVRSGPYSELAILEKINNVRKILREQELPNGIKDRINDIYETEVFSEGGLVFIPKLTNENLLVIGDLHGDEATLEAILEQYQVEKKLRQGKLRVAFLGDYILHGRRFLELLMRIMDLKIEYPERVILLRGNHDERETEEQLTRWREKRRKIEEETPDKTFRNFADEIKPHYEDKVYVAFIELFEHMSTLIVTANQMAIAHAAPPAEKIHSLRELVGNLALHEEMQNNFIVTRSGVELKPLKKGKWVTAQAFDDFLQTIGATVFIRGHLDNAALGKKVFNGRLETIISHGGVSPDDGGVIDYWGEEGGPIPPRFALLPLDRKLKSIPSSSVHKVSEIILQRILKRRNAQRSEVRSRSSEDIEQQIKQTGLLVTVLTKQHDEAKNDVQRQIYQRLLEQAQQKLTRLKEEAGKPPQPAQDEGLEKRISALESQIADLERLLAQLGSFDLGLVPENSLADKLAKLMTRKHQEESNPDTISRIIQIKTKYKGKMTTYESYGFNQYQESEGATYDTRYEYSIDYGDDAVLVSIPGWKSGGDHRRVHSQPASSLSVDEIENLKKKIPEGKIPNDWITFIEPVVIEDQEIYMVVKQKPYGGYSQVEAYRKVGNESKRKATEGTIQNLRDQRDKIRELIDIEARLQEMEKKQKEIPLLSKEAIIQDLRDKKERLQKELSTNESRSELRANINHDALVAIQVMNAIFAVSFVSNFGENQFLIFLRSVQPDLFKDEKSTENLLSLLSQEARQTTGSFEVVRIFEQIPDLSNRQIRILVSLAARSKASITLVIPFADRNAVQTFRTQIQLKIIQERRKARLLAQGINLKIITSKDSLSFNSPKDRLLVYGSHSGIDHFFKSAKAGRKLHAEQMLFVQEDRENLAEKLKQDSAFLAALDDFFTATNFPKNIIRASDLLKLHLDILPKLAQFIAASA